jgi:hypothetical protein
MKSHLFKQIVNAKDGNRCRKKVVVIVGLGVRNQDALPPLVQNRPVVTKKKSAYGPKFVLVKGFVVCTDEERLYAHTSLQQILRKKIQIFNSTRLRNKDSAHREGCPRRGNESRIV